MWHYSIQSFCLLLRIFPHQLLFASIWIRLGSPATVPLCRLEVPGGQVAAVQRLGHGPGQMELHPAQLCQSPGVQHEQAAVCHFRFAAYEWRHQNAVVFALGARSGHKGRLRAKRVHLAPSPHFACTENGLPFFTFPLRACIKRFFKHKFHITVNPAFS